MPINYDPTLNGQYVLGAATSFTSNVLNGTPADEDTWLGLTPGTTRYAPGQNGTGWAVSGMLTGQTSAAAAAARATLAGYAGLTVPFGRPTGRRWPNAWEVRRSCYFEAWELVFNAGGIVVVAPNAYGLSYLLVLHEIGGIVTPT